ncbi:MAG: imidazolonepropionase, partial [Caldivirga sp.]
MKAQLVIGPIGQLVTAKSMPWRPDDEALVLEDAGLVINNGVITDLGPWEVVRSRYNASQVMNADGLLVTAGLIDPHTHLLFAGSREDEFELKVMGATYEDILKGGGGIYRTINDTIRAGDSELISIGLGRLNRALSHGTTTIEVKSGYGLTMEQEVRLLRLINELGRLSKVDVIPTFLAHVPPRSG